MSIPEVLNTLCNNIEKYNEDEALGSFVYQVYRLGVNGVTMTGVNMVEYHEMPEKQRKAWNLVGSSLLVKSKIEKLKCDAKTLKYKSATDGMLPILQLEIMNDENDQVEPEEKKTAPFSSSRRLRGGSRSRRKAKQEK